jgi:periplasmic divalent cation tolerance protein
VAAPAALDVVAVVLSTVPDEATAERIAKALVEERLAACVNRVPGVGSIYRWQGAIEESEEILLVIKTHARRAPQVTQRLRELHPYEIPEILVLPVAAGLGAYLDWIRRETQPEGEGE